jgi:hypothetical protein
MENDKMRVNIYAEEMTNRIEIIEKEIDGIKFEACRFYLYLPTSYTPSPDGPRTDLKNPTCEIQGPFIHREGDDDSSAVTFWSRGKLREILQQAIDLLDQHHANKNK